MRHFHYVARRENGLPAKGWLLSASRDDALMALRRRGYQPLVVRLGPNSIVLKAPIEELLASIRELANLRESGMALDQAVQSLSKLSEHKILRKAWAQIAKMILSGLSLSDAMGSIPDVFPRYSVAMVKLGEASGQLADALRNVAQRMEEEMGLRSEIKAAMTYPAFLLVISAAVFVFLFLVVIPRFGNMVQSASTADAGGLVLLLNISGFMNDYLWVWSGLLAVLVVAAAHGWKTGVAQAKLLDFMKKLPKIGEIIESWEIVIFSRSIGRLLAAGVSLLDAIKLSVEVVNRVELRQGLQKVVTQVQHGKTLAAALKAQEVFPPLVIQMVTLGEASASLPESMDQVANVYERRMRQSIKKALALLEPAVIVGMGLFIGSIMITLLSAIITVNDIPL